MSTDLDYPKPVVCQQCGDAKYICELPDGTCRFKGEARIFLAALTHTGHVSEDDFEEVAHALARLLRKTEDGAWERLSVARTRGIDRAEQLLRAATEAVSDSMRDSDKALLRQIEEWIATRPRH